MRVLLVVIVLLLPCAARSAKSATAQEIIDLYNQGGEKRREKVLSTLRREYDGMRWMQEFMQRKHKTQGLICADDDVHDALFKGEGLVDVMKHAVETTPRWASDLFPMVLLLGLQDAYPCKKPEEK